MRAMTLWVLAATTVFPALGHATTWHVTADPGHPEGRVAAAVAAAASGDTILIDPGVFYEHVTISRKSLCFLGAGSGRSAILDGSREPSGGTGSVLALWGPAQLQARGVTFRRGHGSRTSLFIGGGAIVAAKGQEPGSLHVSVEDCAFEENMVQGAVGPGYVGGAIYIESGDVDVKACSFRSNAAASYGGALAAENGNVTVTDSAFEFSSDAAETGAAIWEDGGTVALDHCTFRSTGSRSSSPGLFLFTESVNITHCTFTALDGAVATGISITTPYPSEGTANVHVSDCVFLSNPFPSPGDFAPGFDFTGLVAAVVLERNTFAGCPISVSQSLGAPVVCTDDIFYKSPVEVDAHYGGTISCCCTWPDSTFQSYRELTILNCFRQDPQFCDLANEDLQIALGSPCSAEHAPSGCGQIGALGTACGESPIERSTWGRIKARYLPKK
jgi:hypothetical protein